MPNLEVTDDNKAQQDAKALVLTESRPLSVGFSSDDFDHMRGQLQLLKKFISSQLTENTDFGLIPNTHKPSLFKPGAEKLQRLFKLGVRYIQTDKELDLKNNFALYSYKAQVYPLSKPEAIISECEGSCNSKEKKYMSRSAADMLNTIQKMAQKRAFVGAIISATGASDYFTQDVEDMDLEASSKPSQARIISTPTELGDYVVPIGKKYKGMRLRDIPPLDIQSFKDWLYRSAEEKKQPLTNGAAEFYDMATEYLNSLKTKLKVTEVIEGQPMEFAHPPNDGVPF